LDDKGFLPVSLVLIEDIDRYVGTTDLAQHAAHTSGGVDHLSHGIALLVASFRQSQDVARAKIHAKAAALAHLVVYVDLHS
jgi:hypothetical protein